MQGYKRNDGRKGIRNVIAVAYLVECAHHVAQEIVLNFRERSEDVHLVGFPGCYNNAYAHAIMERLLTHPNVGAVLLVSLGCEGFNKHALQETIAASGRPVELVTIQKHGGTRSSITQGTAWIEEQLEILSATPTVPLAWSDISIGTVCGGSDGTSGLTANPAVGRAFDTLVDLGATCLFEETGELIGCEGHMAERAATPELGEAIKASVAKAARYYKVLGQGSFAPGNAEGGLTTIEEKSLGAYAKSGAQPIIGLIKPGELPPKPGLYLLDVVPDGEVRFGFPNIVDNAEIVEMIASGVHITLFTTGRGSVVGSALAPVIKVCANPQTYERLREDMDVNAGAILSGERDLDAVGQEIVECIQALAGGQQSKSESLGHREFILGYKQFTPSGPTCFPA